MAKKSIVERFVPKAVGFGLNSLALVSSDKAAEKALEVFCTPRGGKILDRQKSFLNRFRKRTINYNDLPIMTYDNGKSGKTILFCHGWESNSSRWRRLYDYLEAENYHIILMDGPAHGESGSKVFTGILYGEMIHQVCEHYKPEKIVAHSIGAFATLYSQCTFGHAYINRLVLLSPPDKLKDISVNFGNLLGLNSKVMDSYYDLIKNRFGDDITYFAASNFASKIDVPGLLIHDRLDKIHNTSDAENIVSHWAQGKLSLTEGFKHSLQDKEVYAMILKELEAK